MTKWPPEEIAPRGDCPMSFEDLPNKPAGITVGEALDLLSVVELEQRVQALETEIDRTKAALQSKRQSKSAADAFFKS
jgi:uncharacterized small protein (DUF1192 family)